MANVSTCVPNPQATMPASYWLQNLESASAIHRRILLMNDISYLADSIQSSPAADEMETHLKFKKDDVHHDEQMDELYKRRSKLKTATTEKNIKLEKLRSMQSKSFLARLFWFIH